MTAEHTAAMSGDAAWMLISAALVLLMTPALACFYGGMAGRRAVLNMMMMSFGSLGVVSVVYVLWGWSMSYGGGSVAGVFANPFTQFGLSGAIVDGAGDYVAGAAGYANVIDVCFQLTFAVIAAALITGAIANRARFATWLVFAAAWVTLAYFPMAHMVWGGGLLSDGAGGIPAALFGTVAEGGGRVARIAPIDFAGGTVVHINAGVAALVLAIIVGPSVGFLRTAHRPHNLPLVMLGAALLWFGWFGFNAGSAFAADGVAGLAWLNTTVAAGAAMLGWLGCERIRDGKATSLGAASGVVAGLVAVTPACGDLTPAGAIALGAVGGVLACLGVGLKYRLKFDDSLDVVGVHLVAGLWGTVGVGLLADGRGLLTGGGADGARLLVVQILIAAAAMVFSGAVTAALGLGLRATMGWRVADAAERSGIDGAEHGETAYDTTTAIPSPRP